jgi:hypothetical protein
MVYKEVESAGLSLQRFPFVSLTGLPLKGCLIKDKKV